MDIATHLLVPYAAALAAFGFLRRGAPGDPHRAALAAVFGVAGFAPDLDGLISWMSKQWDALYFLQHRGVSHTLVGAPLFALVLVGALALAARAWPRRFAVFSWRRGFLAAAVLGSFTHLILDGITFAGVPLLWPFWPGRFGFPLFHWLVIWLLPIGGVALLAHAFGRLSRRGVIVAGALVVAVLVVIGGIRVTTRPWGEDEGTLVFPRASEFEWALARRLENDTWEMHTYRAGERFEYAWFEHRVPPDAARVVERLRDTDAYRGFLMGRFGPEVVQAAPLAHGGWNVTFTDIAQRYEAMHLPRWTPTEPHENWGWVAFETRGDAVSVTHRGW